MRKGKASINRDRVLLALSGGVDSAVAAAILIETGYKVTGITFNLWASPPPGIAVTPGSFPAYKGIERARRIADTLAIPHRVADLQEQFEASVVSYFTTEYSCGRTPNPCIVCNRTIKFAALLQKAEQWSIPFIATGHYARVEYCAAKDRYLLKKGVDRAKDQSYMLYQLTQEQLARSLFPLGGLTKQTVRVRAEKLGLVAAAQKESQELCFIPGNDYRVFLKNRGFRASPGPIVDRSGRVLGRHCGIPFYTVGQRRGLGLSSRHPLYVLELNPVDNSIVVGERNELYRSVAEVAEINLIALPALKQEEKVAAKIRYRAPAVPARLVPQPPEHNRARLVFKTPQPAVTPGQAAVFYRDELLLGGGVITSGA